MSLPIVSDSVLPDLPAEVDARLSIFPGWRKGQRKMVLDILMSDKRFVAAAMPVGGGKSLAYITAALLNGGRTAVLTASKGLQDQIHEDFAALGLHDVRGRSNYLCRAFTTGAPGETMISCDDAAGLCPSVACGYKDAIHQARDPQTAIVSTNFSAWIYQHKYSQGFGNFDLLIVDEAHGILEEMTSALAVELSCWDLYNWLRLRPPAGDRNVAAWARLAQLAKPKADDLLDQARQDADSHKTKDTIRRLRMAKRVAQAIGEMSQMDPQSWVLTQSRSQSNQGAQDTGTKGADVWRFEPVWPDSPTLERYLWCGAKKVVLTSATIVRKTLHMLGLTTAGESPDCDWFSYPYQFDYGRSPVYIVPCARMSHRNRDQGDEALVNDLRPILARRSDRKGIIHCHSFARRDLIVSRLGGRFQFIVHGSGDSQSAVREFSRAGAGAILLSPSVTTGYNFAHDAARYQVICKVPFPNTQDPALQARKAVDPEYIMYLAAQALEQIVGRPMRADDDWCETIILDDNIRWFLKKYRHLFDSWFFRLLRWVDYDPGPPPLDSS